jgi:hypothetical protein
VSQADQFVAAVPRRLIRYEPFIADIVGQGSNAKSQMDCRGFRWRWLAEEKIKGGHSGCGRTVLSRPDNIVHVGRPADHIVDKSGPDQPLFSCVICDHPMTFFCDEVSMSVFWD